MSTAEKKRQQREKDLASRLAKKRNSELLLETRGQILIIKINRPQCKNALNRNAVYDLVRAFSDAKQDANIKLVVLTAVGDTFCAGTDLKQMQEYQNPDDYYFSANYVLRSLIKTILNCSKIVVCLVNGPCIGIGFTLAALCDVVYCTNDAYFQTPFTQLGLCPEACSSVTFPQIFGPAWSSKLLLFNEKLPADIAANLGFVAEVYKDLQDVEEKFWHKFEGYAGLPWNSLRVTKRLMRLHNKTQLLLALDAELKEIGKLRKADVYQKAIKEFLERSQKGNKSKL